MLQELTFISHTASFLTLSFIVRIETQYVRFKSIFKSSVSRRYFCTKSLDWESSRELFDSSGHFPICFSKFTMVLHSWNSRHFRFLLQVLRPWNNLVLIKIKLMQIWFIRKKTNEHTFAKDHLSQKTYRWHGFSWETAKNETCATTRKSYSELSGEHMLIISTHWNECRRRRQKSETRVSSWTKYVFCQVLKNHHQISYGIRRCRA